MNKILDLARLRAIFVIVVAMLLCFGVIDVGVRAAVGMIPARLARADFLQPRLLDWTGGRIAGIEKARRDSPDARRPLAVVMGFSTAFEGLVPELLDASDPRGRKWVNLAARGGSFSELTYYVRPLTWSELQPDLIVLGVHPGFMAGRINVGDFDEAHWKTALRRISWFVFNRNRINITLRRMLSDLRAELFLDLDLPLDALFPPPADPWAEQRGYEGHAKPAVLAKQMHGFERLGWFRPAHYREDDSEVAAAHEVIRACEEKAKHVVIVFMPESSSVRGRMPPEAEATFRRALVGLPYQPPIIDLRDRVPDAVFFDYTHPNPDGRPIISKLFMDQLKAIGG